LEILQTNNSQKLDEIISRIGLETGYILSPKVQQDLQLYFQELQAWNKKINLTGIKELGTLVQKHLGDTLLLLEHMPKGVHTVLDIGTGAGIPGILMKIIRPELYMVLAEGVKKKCSFLKFIIAKLGLKDVFVEQRLIGPQTPPRHLPALGFDLIVSQATGSLKWFVETALGFLAPEGSMIMLKGPSGWEEIKSCQFFLQQAGLSINTIETSLPIANHKRLLIECKFSSL